ncbi:MAG: hypothetical protein PGMFKBFP_00463 [Anaerolineales bacterium]|nr:hypothetical protein [Anaerolineales bacterium]
MRPLRQLDLGLVRDGRLGGARVGVRLDINGQDRIRDLRGQPFEVDEIPEVETRLAGRERGIGIRAQRNLRLAQADHPLNLRGRGSIVARPRRRRVVPLRGDPAAVHEDGAAVVETERREQVIAIALVVILVPQRDLVGKIIRPADDDGAVFQRGEVGVGFRVQVQRRHGAHGKIMRVEGAPLLEPVQLPDAETRARRRADEGEERGENPFAGKENSQGHCFSTRRDASSSFFTGITRL